MCGTTTIHTQVYFQVARWSYWTSAKSGGQAEIPEVPVMLRRRASAADRAALRVAFDCVTPGNLTPAVFCSRRGEMHRSVELLEQLARKEPLSPAVFSVSVHNAAAAIFSIARQDASPMSAIAAGRDSLAQGVLEAAGQLADGAEQVLLVAYDETLPPEFAAYKDEDDPPEAFAALLTRSEGARYSLEFGPVETGSLASGTQVSAVAAFFRAGQAKLEIASAPRRWVWRRHD